MIWQSIFLGNPLHTSWTPIQAWPRRKFRGSTGYSAGHYARLAGAAEDPLTVAERIVTRRRGEANAAGVREKLSAGEGHESVLDWLAREQQRQAFDDFRRLSESFDAVISVLESEPQTPAMKRLVREAKRAKARKS